MKTTLIVAGVIGGSIIVAGVAGAIALNRAMKRGVEAMQTAMKDPNFEAMMEAMADRMNKHTDEMHEAVDKV